MCSLCRLPVAKSHNFGQILTCGGSCTDPLLPMRAKFSALEQTHGIRLLHKFCLDRFILSPSGCENPNFLAVFGLRHLVVSPIGSSLRKLEHECTTTNLPLSNGISVFQRLHGEIWRTNSDVQKRDGQTDIQTKYKQTKNSTFLAATAAGEIRAQPNLAR